MARYKFAFPVYNAFLDKDIPSFQVADVLFVKKSELSKEQKLPYEDKLQLTDNQIFAVVNVCGDLDHAEKVAYDKCCFATDIFKICSDLYHDKKFNPGKWQFDTNSDFVTQRISFFYSKELDSDSSTRLKLTANRNTSSINAKFLDSVSKWNIKDFESLYNAVFSPDAKSIHKELKRACRLYSQSFSINNRYERVVLLCAVLDTLATCERTGKLPQLQKYLPPLVLKCERLSENLKSFIAQVYDIRSAYVHNAEENGISDKDVGHLEKIVYRVVLQMARNSTKYKSIKEICTAIDNGTFETILDNLQDIYVPERVSTKLLIAETTN